MGPGLQRFDRLKIWDDNMTVLDEHVVLIFKRKELLGDAQLDLNNVLAAPQIKKISRLAKKFSKDFEKLMDDIEQK